MWICERCVKCTGCTPQLIIVHSELGEFYEKSCLKSAFLPSCFECRYLDKYFINYIQTFCGCTLHYYGENRVSGFSSRP